MKGLWLASAVALKATAPTWDAESDRAYALLKPSNTIAKGQGTGVVYSAAGSAEFARREVVPTVKYLRSMGKRTQYAIFVERSVLEGLDDATLSFFDFVLKHHKSDLPLKSRVKLLKIQAMRRSPFLRTIYLDFDSRPCRPDFVDFLPHASLALTNKFEDQRPHYELEHNSALMVLQDAGTFLAYYEQAFLALQGTRDQPALMVALKKAAEEGLAHVDLSPTVFCRSKISEVVSCDACVVVHKPQKHDLSLKVFVLGRNPNVALMLEQLKIEPKCSAAERWKVTDDVLNGNYDSVLPLAAKYRVFSDFPWAYKDVWKLLLDAFPRAKFILTLEWHNCRRSKFAKVLESREEHDQRNQEIIATIPKDRLLVMDELKWSNLCSFVEAWTRCPSSRVPNVQSDVCRPTPATPKAPKPPPPKLKGQNSKKAVEMKAVPRWHDKCKPSYPRGVFYNRIPKSGSASIMSWMAGQLNATARAHGFAQTNVTWWTPHVAKHRWLTPSDEQEFLSSVREFGAMGPFVTQRHVYHTPALASTHPLGVALVNVVRDPVDRCVSRYNYEAFYKKRIPPVDFNECLDDDKRCGATWDLSKEQHFYKDYPVPSVRASAADKQRFMDLSYDQSMALLMDECHDYMTRWFCGHGPECRTDQALTIAKRNVDEQYVHVGVLEDLPNTVQLFRLLLPGFFLGDPATTPDEADFPELHSDKALKRLTGVPTRKSGPLSVKNYELLRRANERDLDLYFYILKQHRAKVALCLKTDGTL